MARYAAPEASVAARAAVHAQHAVLGGLVGGAAELATAAEAEGSQMTGSAHRSGRLLRRKPALRSVSRMQQIMRLRCYLSLRQTEAAEAAGGAPGQAADVGDGALGTPADVGDGAVGTPADVGDGAPTHTLESVLRDAEAVGPVVGVQPQRRLGELLRHDLARV
eukprot:jgi/Ulvmu1/3989/UM183_0008.1